MYNFIICEDNFNTGILLKKIITEYANEKNLDYNIKLFNENFDQVIEFTKSNIGHVNVFFMDIILNEENSTGLTLAKQIRKIDVLAYFIIITSHPELSLKVFNYRIKALDCIFKQEEDIEKRIYECLDTVVSESLSIDILTLRNQITLKSTNGIHPVNLSDILYFETRPGSRLIYCVLVDRTCIAFRNTMKELIKDLDSRFFQCHRSYIINTKFIKKFCINRQSYSVIMADGKICDVSRPKWKELLSHVRI
ncbi:MAG: response regulator transcription factor [Clostridiaceae bacterium]|nr:response regulator transcription factor [Clostridiaceae bacterium]